MRNKYTFYIIVTMFFIATLSVASYVTSEDYKLMRTCLNMQSKEICEDNLPVFKRAINSTKEN